MGIEEKVIAESRGRLPGIRSARGHGRYADRVRITDAGQSSYAGRTGTVERTEPGNWGTVYVRFYGTPVAIPFARSEVEVLT